MRSFFTTVLGALLLGACSTIPTTNVAAPGVVSAADPRAAEAGAAMLRQGGSATDAALATLLALTVVEPQSSGIGGGGFLVTSDSRGRVASYDGREEAPAAATPEWFFRDGVAMKIDDAIPGGRSVGVPGNVRMMALAHEAHGGAQDPGEGDDDDHADEDVGDDVRGGHGASVRGRARRAPSGPARQVSGR